MVHLQFYSGVIITCVHASPDITAEGGGGGVVLRGAGGGAYIDRVSKQTGATIHVALSCKARFPN